MEGSNGTSNSPAPFLLKIYEMVEDPVTNSVVSWSHTGHSFVVWNPPEFARDLLPNYFKHNNFSSFIRQLNTYGFRKVDPDQWEFANEEFIRGQRHLLKNIHRRKPVHSHSGQGNAVSLSELERGEFEKEIDKLKQEKVYLQLEVEQHKQEKETQEYKLRSLGQTLQNIDQRQRHLLSKLAQLLQKSGYTTYLSGQSESQSKKRRLLALNYLHDGADMGENQIITFPDDSKPSLVNMDVIKTLDSSLNFWETFLHGMDQAPSEELLDFGVPLLPSPAVITEMPPCTPECHASASPSHDLSSNYAESPPISSICIDHLPGIDVNTRPSNTYVLTTKDRGQDGSIMRAGANDIFWQQFLMEAPGSSVIQEVQSGRKDPSGVADEHKSWWNVDKLSQQMGHLAQVETT